MAYSEKVAEEVKACFKADEKLIGMTLTQIAEYFYIQGETRHTALVDALKCKVEHYRKYLSVADFDALKKLDKDWNETI
jgi:hypothetical protein